MRFNPKALVVSLAVGSFIAYAADPAEEAGRDRCLESRAQAAKAEADKAVVDPARQ